MFTKSHISAASVVVLGLLGFISVAHANTDQSSTDQNVAKRIDYLQNEINDLKRQLRKQKNIATKTKPVTDASGHTYDHPIHQCRTGDCSYNPSRVSIGPYLNKDRLFDGSELLINIPSVREDSRLLLQQAILKDECNQLGIPAPQYPRLQFSGRLEGFASFTNPYSGPNVNNINFTGAELDTLIQGTPWVTGYMALEYNPNTVNNASTVFMNRAFITLGNLSQFPVYGTIGQVYVPFGRYSSGLMVTSPTPLSLARVRARSLELGYQQTGSNAFHAEVFTYQGLTNPVGSTTTNNQWGADAGYAYKLGRFSGEVGSSYISNLGDSQGLQATVFNTIGEIQHYNVPAIDGYGSLAIDPFVFIAEYVTALRSFNINDVNFANHGAKPSAFHAEGDYTFKTGSKPSSVGIGYDHTAQALEVGLPQEIYELFYNVNIWRDTNLNIEYRHDINYSASAATTGSINPTPASINSTLGKSDNAISAQFDLYF